MKLFSINSIKKIKSALLLGASSIFLMSSRVDEPRCAKKSWVNIVGNLMWSAPLFLLGLFLCWMSARDLFSLIPLFRDIQLSAPIRSMPPELILFLTLRSWVSLLPSVYAVYLFWVSNQKALSKEDQKKYEVWLNDQPKFFENIISQTPSAHDWNKLKRHGQVFYAYQALRAEEEKKELSTSTSIVKKSHAMKRL